MSRNISSMIAEVRSQTSEVRSVVDRLRNANRRLTGATGETPTKLSDARDGNNLKASIQPPLLEDLNSELEQLNAATADLRNEVNFLEGISETGAAQEAAGYAKQADVGYAVKGDSYTR